MNDTIEKIAALIEKAPDIFARVKAIFPKKKKKSEDEAVEDVVKAAADAVAKATDADQAE